MKPFILGCILLMGLGTGVAAESKYLTMSESVKVPTPAVVEAPKSSSTQVKKGNYGLSLTAGLSDYSTALSYTPIMYTLTWQRYEPQRNISWYLEVQSSLKEKSIAKGKVLYVSDTYRIAVFNTLSVFGLGGGFRGYFSEGWFGGLSAHYLFFSNAATHSGFDGYELGAHLGYTFEMTPQWTLQPQMGVQFLYLLAATLDGTRGRLSNSLSGLGYNVALQSEYRF